MKVGGAVLAAAGFVLVIVAAALTFVENTASAKALDDEVRDLQSLARRIVRISDERYAIELPLECPPERVIPELTALGATLVSANPIRETLEDFFVQQVTSPAASRNELRVVGGRG